MNTVSSLVSEGLGGLKRTYITLKMENKTAQQSNCVTQENSVVTSVLLQQFTHIRHVLALGGLVEAGTVVALNSEGSSVPLES